MRIFISSTFKDLLNHRIAVADALERLGLQLNRMEKFGAIPKDSTTGCFSEIEESELFLGIYAHRYGYIPDNSSISITEAEFDHAYNNRRPTFCFFIDEAYPWSTEYIDSEPSQSLLKKFKKRIEQLIIRDYFTTPDILSTRVTASIGRYLISDPRKHGAIQTAQFARLTLTDAATMVFVDVMRLACVAGSDAARKVNEPRYNEFVDVADLHLNDFRIQVTRLASDCDFDTITKCTAVERGLAWAIVRLRRAPQLDPSWEELIVTLYNLAERINALSETISRDYYSAQKDEVVTIFQAASRQYSATTLFHSPDDFIRCRLLTQSMLLGYMREVKKFTVETIRDDIDKQLAINYFLIDLCLLRKVIEKQR